MITKLTYQFTNGAKVNYVFGPEELKSLKKNKTFAKAIDYLEQLSKKEQAYEKMGNEVKTEMLDKLADL